MNSLASTDLTGDKKAKLEGHLKSDDFFGVKTFPTSTFEIISLAPLSGVKAGEPNFNVTGKLTIKGKTNDISFPATIKFDGPNMTATGTVKVDRSKYDVRYGSKTFYADIGDKAIADEFGGPIQVIDWASRHDALTDCATLINTTSQGMHGQASLDLSLTRLPSTTLVADAIYVPLETPLLIAARLRGNLTVNGLGMLMNQARPAFNAWFGVMPGITPELLKAVHATF